MLRSSPLIWRCRTTTSTASCGSTARTSQATKATLPTTTAATIDTMARRALDLGIPKLVARRRPCCSSVSISTRMVAACAARMLRAAEDSVHLPHAQPTCRPYPYPRQAWYCGNRCKRRGHPASTWPSCGVWPSHGRMWGTGKQDLSGIAGGANGKGRAQASAMRPNPDRQHGGRQPRRLAWRCPDGSWSRGWRVPLTLPTGRSEGRYTALSGRRAARWTGRPRWRCRGRGTPARSGSGGSPGGDRTGP